MSAGTGRSVYETWVFTLREWADNPQTSLDELPPLDEETFTPATYQRLMKHLIDSVNAVSSRWVEALDRTFVQVESPSELGAALVSLRSVLARRAQLATHASLPEPVREVLVESMRLDLERAQAHIEEAIRRNHSAARMDSVFTDQMLQVLRDNRFTTVLEYTFTDADGRLEIAPLPEVTRDEARPARRFRPRRIVNTPHCE